MNQFTGDLQYPYPPSVILSTPPLDGSAIEAIGRQAIATERAKAEVILPQTYQVLTDQAQKQSYLLTYKNSEVKSSVLFFNGYVEHIYLLKYPEYLNWDNIYLLDICASDECVLVPIPEKIWGTTKMIYLMNRYGIRFSVKLKSSVLIQILLNHLADLTRCRYWQELSPYSGWYLDAENPTYRTEDNWMFPDIPSFVKNKSFGLNKSEDTMENGLTIALNYLSALIPTGKRLLLLSILHFSVVFQLLKIDLGCSQDKTIIFRCETAQIKSYIKNFYRIFNYTDSQTLTLSYLLEKFKQELLIRKDEPIVIDGDTIGAKKQREEHKDMIIDYVKGTPPYPITSSAPIIICCKGLIPDFPLSEAVIIELNTSDFNSPLLSEKLSTLSVTSELAHSIITFTEKNYSFFKKNIMSLLGSQEPDLCTLFNILSEFILYYIQNYKPDLINQVSKEQFMNLIQQIKENLDVYGAGDMVIEELANVIENHTLLLKKHLTPIEKNILPNTIFYNSELVFVQDKILERYILPKICTSGTPILHLVTAQKDQGYLDCYSGKADKVYSDGYRKKIRVKYVDGSYDNISVISINRKVFENLNDFDLFELRGE